LPISATIFIYYFNVFPPFFDGLLPEGFNLDALCRNLKIDIDDSFSQLLAVGKDGVGSITVEPVEEID
jgi:serine/threonine-protein kinase HipA